MAAWLFGVIVGVPVLRLSGDYLAIVTLAFGEIIKNIINACYLGYDSTGLHFSLQDQSSMGLDPDGTVLAEPDSARGVLSPDARLLAVEQASLDAVPLVQRRLGWLATFANVATLFGLLGTILGLIQSFEAVSTADPEDKQALLASGIALAMRATAAGLTVAIPSLLLHSWLVQRANALLDDVDRTAQALAEQLPRLGPEQAELRLERTPGQFLVKGKNIPFMRLRELVFHHVDLLGGFGFTDVEPEVQRLLLDEEVRRLRTCDPPPDVTLRTPDGDEWSVGAGTASVSGDRGALLGWLGRGLTAGVTGDHLPRLPEGR